MNGRIKFAENIFSTISVLVFESHIKIWPNFVEIQMIYPRLSLIL